VTAAYGLGWTLVVLLTVAVIVPLSPRFPSEEFESQWYAGLNQAVAQHMRFGREFVFTYGPYASVANRTFHPDTDALMLGGGLALALGYAALLFLAARRSRAYWLFPYLLILSGFWYPRDVLLFTYCLLMLLAAYRLATQVEGGVRRRPSMTENGLLLAGAAVLGLLPLIKGSVLLLVVCTMAACFVMFLLSSYWVPAAGIVLLPVAAAMMFWNVAGQSASALPDFLWALVQLSAAYTEAMAYAGNVVEPALYVVAALVSLSALLLGGKWPATHRVVLSAGYAAFLFVAFKAGLVRSVAAPTSGTALLLGALLMTTVLPSRRLRWSVLCAAVVAFGTIDRNHVKTSAGGVAAAFSSTVTQGMQGVRARASGNAVYEEEFRLRMAELSRRRSFPRFEGTTDIYSYLQGYLLASPNTWSPRPVFQSYAAYTPALLNMNARHLEGNRAPDHILFRIEAIDGRLPSLEDGLSWPGLLSTYSFDGIIGEFIHLVRDRQVRAAPVREFIHQGVHALGEAIAIPVPQGRGPVFAEIDISPRVLGRIAETLFTVSPIRIVLTFADGHTESYRYVSGMGRTPFLLSPRVAQNIDFLLLAAPPRYLANSRVTSMQLIANPRLWRPSFSLRLTSAALERADWRERYDVFDRLVTDLSELGPITTTDCDGTIDELNGGPVGPGLDVASTLTVKGWVAVSGKDGIASDAPFVTLTAANGQQTIVKARKTPRPDVRQYFGRPDMAPPGFEAFVDVSDLQGVYTLGVSRRYQDAVAACRNLTVPIRIR